LNLSRRQVLRGAFGATLAIPLLRSLLPEKEARASYTTRKYFVSMQTEHGCAWGKNMYPGDATLTEKRNYAGHEIRSGRLVPLKADGKATLCPILSASATTLTDKLAAKLNVIRGLDIPIGGTGHSPCTALGNYAHNAGEGVAGAVPLPYLPTIDQIMAWSPNFYSDLSSIRERALVAASESSYNYSNPKARTGPVQAIGSSYDSAELMSRIFVSNAPGGRKPIADLVLADYNRMRSSSGISKDDQRRLDDHMQRISELQRRLNVRADCSAVKVPTGKTGDYMSKANYGVTASLQESAWEIMNDVIVAAFMCGTSRIAVTRAGDGTSFSDYPGSDWHHEVAHLAYAPDEVKQKLMVGAYQAFFEKVFLDLATKLDAIDDGTGRSLLDNAVIMWSQESGPIAHSRESLPIVTAGSAGGFFKTGIFADYRNLATQMTHDIAPGIEVTHAGLLHGQWLGTLLQSMGIERSEYETTPNGGYGIDLVDTSATAYPAAVREARKEILPFLK
jgi:hypothetical protein